MDRQKIKTFLKEIALDTYPLYLEDSSHEAQIAAEGWLRNKAKELELQLIATELHNKSLSSKLEIDVQRSIVAVNTSLAKRTTGWSYPVTRHSLCNELTYRFGPFFNPFNVSFFIKTADGALKEVDAYNFKYKDLLPLPEEKRIEQVLQGNSNYRYLLGQVRFNSNDGTKFRFVLIESFND